MEKGVSSEGATEKDLGARDEGEEAAENTLEAWGTSGEAIEDDLRACDEGRVEETSIVIGS